MTTATEAAALAYAEALELRFLGRPEWESRMREALAFDDRLLMAQVALGAVDQSSAAKWERELSSAELADWERGRLEIVLARARADEGWVPDALEHAKRFPGDALTFEELHAYTFFFGDTAMRQRRQRARDRERSRARF